MSNESPKLTPELDFAKLDVLQRIDAMAEAMLKQDPLIPTHLGAIHKTLLMFPELIHILPQDRVIPVMMEAQKKQIGVELTKEITKKGSRAKVSTSLDDL